MSDEVTNNEEVVENNEVTTNNEEVKQPSADELLSQMADLKKQLEEANKKAADAASEAKKHRKDKTATKGELETIETVRTQLQEELDGERTKYNALIQQLSQRDVQDVIGKALNEAKCLAPRVVSREIADRIETNYDVETGKTTIVVKDSEGKQMFVKGNPATVSDLIKSLREDPELSHAFEGIQEGGTGATAPNDLKARNVQENPWKTGNVSEQHRLGREKPDLAKKLRDEARGKPKPTFARL